MYTQTDFKTKTALTEMDENIDFEMQEITYLPHAEHEITADNVEAFERFINLMNELEDVQEIYHNGSYAS